MGHPATDGTSTYVARVLGEVQYRPGAWNGVRVGVFRREGESETQIGEYERNYPSLFDTFHPFQADGRDLALYSPHYTGTRLLELPACRDIGGEEPSSDGFCPVEFYVPRKARPARTELHHHAQISPPRHHPFGFVAGCVWGDDNSWKVQYLDLSRAAEGILRRDERFGYIELPEGFTLERAVDLSEYQLDPDEDYAHRIRITAVRQFDLRDGRAITR